MNFRTVLAIAAIALPGAALAQGKGGQGKASIAQCSVMPMEAETLECACPPGFGTGDAWGSGPYTGDSDI